MAAFRSSRQMIIKLNIQEININLSSERPRAIAATRWGQGKKKYNKNKGGQHEKILHLFGFTVPGECC